MSVPFIVVIEEEEKLAGMLSEKGLDKLLESDALEPEETSDDEVRSQMFFLDCYENFEEELPDRDRKLFDDFVNIVFWSWREDDGKQTLQTKITCGQLDTALSPETCLVLADTFDGLNRNVFEENFEPDDDFEEFEDFWDYIEEWRNLLKKAADDGKSLYVFVLG